MGRSIAALCVLQLLACGDRSPPALWPEPPPPTLAAPLGIAAPSTTGDAATDGDAVTTPVAAEGDVVVPVDGAATSSPAAADPDAEGEPEPGPASGSSVTPTQRPTQPAVPPR